MCNFSGRPQKNGREIAGNETGKLYRLIMMPIHVFILMFFIQVCGYILLDIYNLSNWKYLLLAIGLILDFFVLPGYFMPEYKEGEFRCGMPALGITLAFWILGGGLIIFTHIVYVIVKTLIKAKKST